MKKSTTPIEKILLVIGFIVGSTLLMLLEPIHFILEIILIIVWNKVIIGSFCKTFNKDSRIPCIINIIIRIIVICFGISNDIAYEILVGDIVITILCAIAAYPAIKYNFQNRKENNIFKSKIKQKYKNFNRDVTADDLKDNGILVPERFMIDSIDIYAKAMLAANALNYDELKILCDEQLYTELANKFQTAKEHTKEYSEKIVDIYLPVITSVYTNSIKTQVAITVTVKTEITTKKKNKLHHETIKEIKQLEFSRYVASKYDEVDQNCDNCGAPLEKNSTKCKYCSTTVDPRNNPNHWVLSDIKNIEE